MKCDFNTVYQCHQKGKDVNKTPFFLHCEETEAKAIRWLSENGGGIYRNILHNFDMEVMPTRKIK